MIIGGGMAFTFNKKIRNVNIGKSLFDEEGFKIVDEIMAKAKAKNVKLHLPLDSIIADKMDNTANTSVVESTQNIPDDWMGLDIGPKSIKLFDEVVGRSKTLVWNGPMGLFEIEKFKHGSVSLLESITKSTKAGKCVSIVGGGDTANLANGIKGAS